MTKAISSETDGNNGLHTYGQIPSTSECEESQDEILAVALEIFIRGDDFCDQALLSGANAII